MILRRVSSKMAARIDPEGVPAAGGREEGGKSCPFASKSLIWPDVTTMTAGLRGFSGSSMA